MKGFLIFSLIASFGCPCAFSSDSLFFPSQRTHDRNSDDVFSFLPQDRTTHKKGPPHIKFTKKEDEKIKSMREKGDSFSEIAEEIGRSHRSVRERYTHYLSAIALQKSIDWSLEDDQRLLKLYEECGPKWKHIADLMGKGDISVKNRYSLIQRRVDKVNKKKIKPKSSASFLVDKVNKKKRKSKPAENLNRTSDTIITQHDDPPQNPINLTNEEHIFCDTWFDFVKFDQIIVDSLKKKTHCNDDSSFDCLG